MKTLNFLLANNSIEHFTLALGVAIAIFIGLLFVRRVVVRRLAALSKKTAAIWDDVLTDCLAATKAPFIASLSVLAGSTQIELPSAIEALPYRAMVLLLILQMGIWATRALRSWLNIKLESRMQAGDGASITNFGVIAFVARLAIWIVVLLSLLDNLGVNITTLVASLGIGGVAVALALQNILGDLFASLSIAIDKPFVVGDFIVVDEHMGTVKNVGLKTTRLQSLGGEELVFANGDLLKSRIRNYKRMADRRIAFTLAVAYDTSPDTLEALAAEIRRIIEAQPGTRFDRAHFKAFGASSLDFEAVYYVLSPDFNLYMDCQQQINLAVLRYCNANRIAFGFPARVVHMAAPPVADAEHA